MKSDQFYMARALRLAELGRYSTQPNPRVGCVVVKNDKIISEAYHQQAGQGHAELLALAQAGKAAHGADVFVSLEPCSHHGRTPPCVDALIKAGPARVIVAMQDPNPLVCGKGIEKLEQHGIATRVGVCEVEARWLNRGFIKRMQTGLPFVTLKLATSLDGRVAMKSGESFWITSDAARRDVHRLRLESCAIVTGINTVLADDPKMTARLHAEDLEPGYTLTDRQPLRVVMDSQYALPDKAAIRLQPGELRCIIAQGSKVSNRQPDVIALPASQGRVAPLSVLEYLGQLEKNSVLIESGGTLAASFVEAGLVDELVVYQAPDIMGASARAMINLPQILEMSEKIKFEYQDLRRIGRDLKITLKPSKTD